MSYIDSLAFCVLTYLKIKLNQVIMFLEVYCTNQSTNQNAKVKQTYHHSYLYDVQASFRCQSGSQLPTLEAQKPIRM